LSPHPGKYGEESEFEVPFDSKFALRRVLGGMICLYDLCAYSG